MDYNSFLWSKKNKMTQRKNKRTQITLNSISKLNFFS